MNPILLQLENFKSFRKAEFTFPQGPGLFFLCGDNQDEPRLEANGAGKTTLWDALYWLFFGVTTRGVKAGDVANWDAGKVKVSVTLDYDVDGALYTVSRTWNPITWRLAGDGIDGWQDLAKDPANLFVSHLGLDRLPCLHSIFMAQAQPMFLDLEAKHKATLFSEVLELDRWLEYSAKASHLAAAADTTIRGLERNLSEAWGKADTLLATDYSQDIRDWSGKQTEKRQILKKRHEDLLGQVNQLKDEIQKGQVLHERAQSRLGTLQRALEGELVVQRREVSGWKPCPTCGTPMPPKTPNKPISKVPQLTEQVNEAKDDLSNATRRNRELMREFDHLHAQVKQLESDIDLLAGESNPFVKKQEAVERELAVATNWIEKLRFDVDQAKARYSRLSFWVRGFKDLRLQLISETLQQLEIEVNSCLTQLGLVDWELRFDVDRETKSGSVQRGFSTKVLSPHNKHLVPWEAWSGGESQRLRIAATMGLSNLIRTSTGSRLNLEVWDEPTQYLSGQGVNDLLESLAERAQVEKRSIWVVDHRSLGFGGFSSIFTVTKDQDGSHIRSNDNG